MRDKKASSTGPPNKRETLQGGLLPPETSTSEKTVLRGKERGNVETPREKTVCDGVEGDHEPYEGKGSDATDSNGQKSEIRYAFANKPGRGVRNHGFKED